MHENNDDVAKIVVLFFMLAEHDVAEVVTLFLMRGYGDVVCHRVSYLSR